VLTLEYPTRAPVRTAGSASRSDEKVFFLGGTPDSVQKRLTLVSEHSEFQAPFLAQPPALFGSVTGVVQKTFVI